jgi:UDP-N-acetylglucosamine 2-epimerase (non-hydrolysing)
VAAFRAGVPVAHVEAGLRSHDRALPWPEEEYRTAIDAGGTLLFAPTALAAANLRDERVRGAVLITGNTGIDAVLRVSADLPSVALRESGAPRILVTCHRRESWARGLSSVAMALRQLAQSGTAAIDVVLHPNPHVSSTLERLLGDCPGVTLVAPCGQRELLGRMRDCDLMLSDSGGVQEEAPALRVPLVVLRDKTERPEGIWSGNTQLVGTSTRQIVDAVEGLLREPAKLAAMARPSLPYGDGLSGQRIAGIIDQWLAS